MELKEMQKQANRRVCQVPYEYREPSRCALVEMRLAESIPGAIHRMRNLDYHCERLIWIAAECRAKVLFDRPRREKKKGQTIRKKKDQTMGLGVCGETDNAEGDRRDCLSNARAKLERSPTSRVHRWVLT